MKARFDLAIADIEPFNFLYNRLAGNKLPAQNVMHDMLREAGYSDADLAECVDTFIVNAKFLGLLKTIAGAERLLTVEHVLEEMPSMPESETPIRIVSTIKGVPSTTATTDWSKVCFYITPIGADDSEHRKHSDLFLNCIVEPALAGSGLNIIRADQIGKPGMITAQIVDHALRSRLVIADLSFHKPECILRTLPAARVWATDGPNYPLLRSHPVRSAAIQDETPGIGVSCNTEI